MNDLEKNFEINFRVVSENDEEFLAIVLNKEDLDKHPDLETVEMKTSPGIIKGTLQCNDDKNVSYFLIVKKNGKPCKATVEIDLQEIEKYEENTSDLSSHQAVKEKSSFSVIFNKYFYHLLFLLIGLYVLYYLYTSKKITSFFSKTSLINTSSGTLPPSPPSVQTQSPPSAHAPSPLSSHSPSIVNGIDILDKLSSSCPTTC